MTTTTTKTSTLNAGDLIRGDLISLYSSRGEVVRAALRVTKVDEDGYVTAVNEKTGREYGLHAHFDTPVCAGRWLIFGQHVDGYGTRNLTAKTVELAHIYSPRP